MRGLWGCVAVFCFLGGLTLTPVRAELGRFVFRPARGGVSVQVRVRLLFCDHKLCVFYVICFSQVLE